MEIEDIQALVKANATNGYICKHLDGTTMLIVVDILSILDKNDFKEFNPNAHFDFTDVPIPYEQLEKTDDNNQSTLSTDIQAKLKDLHSLINQEGSNIEYPFLIGGAKDEEYKYSHIKPFETNTESTQSCSYDWKFIENVIADTNNKPKNYALLHTHPKAIGKQYNTLFNKYPNELAELGLKADGLNLSLSDLYANMYLDMLIEKYDKPITSESLVLMHDGKLISFSTNKGVRLANEWEIDKISKNKQYFEQMQN